jgi:hypothetical protein
MTARWKNSLSSGGQYLIKIESTRMWPPDDKDVVVGGRTFCQLCHTPERKKKKGKVVPSRVSVFFSDLRIWVNVPWMSECSLYFHWMFPVFSLNVPCIFTECSLDVHWMLTECSLIGWAPVPLQAFDVKLSKTWHISISMVRSQVYHPAVNISSKLNLRECDHPMIKMLLLGGARFANCVILRSEKRKSEKLYLRGCRSSFRTFVYEWMFPEWVNVPCIFTECSLYFHWMFSGCSLNVDWMFTDQMGTRAFSGLRCQIV